MRADPSVKPEFEVDRVTGAGHRAYTAMKRGEWRNGVGWLTVTVSAAVDAADAVSKRTGLGDTKPARAALGPLTRAMEGLRLSLPEARAEVRRALAG